MKFRVEVHLLIDVDAGDTEEAKRAVLERLGTGDIGGDDIAWLEVGTLFERSSREGSST